MEMKTSDASNVFVGFVFMVLLLLKLFVQDHLEIFQLCFIGLLPVIGVVIKFATTFPYETATKAVIDSSEHIVVTRKTDHIVYDGTIVELQSDNKGIVIPHDYSMFYRLPFELLPSDIENASFMIGDTVEFSISTQEPQKAIHLVRKKLNLIKAVDRHNIMAHKQEVRESFDRAMSGLKQVSQRHQPIHHVDLIKYAQDMENDNFM